MKLSALICTTLLAFGCDDPAVADKANAILEHGSVEAHVTCSGNVVIAGASTAFEFDAKKLIDGSSVQTARHAMNAQSDTAFCGRSESCSQSFQVKTMHLTAYETDFSVANGELTVTPQSPASPVVVDLASECTGFNLEAFGVE